MVVLHVKRVWDGAAWEDVEFLYRAGAMDATAAAVCGDVCAVCAAHAAVGRLRALLAARGALPPQAHEMVARTLADAQPASTL